MLTNTFSFQSQKIIVISMPLLVMVIFNRFFDSWLNRLSKNQFFFRFSKIRFRSIGQIKIKKLILTTSRQPPVLFFVFLTWLWNNNYSKRNIYILKSVFPNCAKSIFINSVKLELLYFCKILFECNKLHFLFFL